MNKLTLKSGLLALMTTATLLSSAAFAEPPASDAAPYHHKMHGEYRAHHDGMHKLFRGLDLTEEQRGQVKQIMQQHRDTMKQNRPSIEERQVRQAKMLDLLSADSFNESEAVALVQAKQQQRQNAAIAKLKVQHDIYQMLTPEQQATFKANLAKGMGRKGDRR